MQDLTPLRTPLRPSDAAAQLRPSRGGQVLVFVLLLSLPLVADIGGLAFLLYAYPGLLLLLAWLVWRALNLLTTRSHALRWSVPILLFGWLYVTLFTLGPLYFFVQEKLEQGVNPIDPPQRKTYVTLVLANLLNAGLIFTLLWAITLPIMPAVALVVLLYLLWSFRSSRRRFIILSLIVGLLALVVAGLTVSPAFLALISFLAFFTSLGSIFVYAVSAQHFVPDETGGR
jgi:hypothetical protein